MGLRLSEGLNLTVHDIDSQTMQVHIREGKGGKDRLVPLPKRTLLALRSHWQTHQPAFATSLLCDSLAGKWFSTPCSVVKRVSKVAHNGFVDTVSMTIAYHCLAAIDIVPNANSALHLIGLNDNNQSYCLFITLWSRLLCLMNSGHWLAVNLKHFINPCSQWPHRY